MEKSNKLKFPKTLRQYSHEKGVKYTARIKFDTLEDVYTYANKYNLTSVAEKKTVIDNVNNTARDFYVLEVNKADFNQDNIPDNLDFIPRRMFEHLKDNVNIRVPVDPTNFISTVPLNKYMMDISKKRIPTKEKDPFTSDYESIQTHNRSITRLKEALGLHALSHIDNPISLGHGLIVQAPLDMVMFTTQDDTKMREHIIQMVAGRVSMITRKELLRTIKQGKIPAESHDGLKLNFLAIFTKELLRFRNINPESNAYKLTEQAINAVLERSKERVKYGEDTKVVIQDLNTIISKWDPDLLKKFGSNASVMSDQLNDIMKMFRVSIDGVKDELDKIQNINTPDQVSLSDQDLKKRYELLMELDGVKIEEGQNAIEIKADLMMEIFINWRFAKGLNVKITTRDGKEIYSRSQGSIDDRKDSKEELLPTSNEIFYDASSLTKSFTCVTILALLETSGKQNLLNARLSDLINNSENGGIFNDITLKELMTHRSGLSYVGKPYDNQLDYTGEEFKQILLNPSNYKRSHDSENPIKYFDANIMLAVFAVEKHFNISFDEYFQSFLKKNNLHNILLDTDSLPKEQIAKTPSGHDGSILTGESRDRKSQYLKGVNTVAHAGLFLNLNSLTDYACKLASNQLGLGSLHNEVFNFNEGGNYSTGRNQSLGGLVKSNILGKQGNCYIFGGTGPSIVYAGDLIITMTSNKMYNPEAVKNGSFKTINSFYLYWLSAWQYIAK